MPGSSWLSRLSRLRAARPQTPLGAVAPLTCTITLEGQPVHYVLRRSQRRTIGLTVDQRGLRVGAPLAAPLTAVETMLHQHARWVLQKLARLQEEAITAPPTLPALKDGVRILYRGQPLRLVFSPSAARHRWCEAGGAGEAEEVGETPGITEATLILAACSEAEREAALIRVLKSRARPYFQARLATYAEAMGLPLPTLSLSSARTRWGSCNSRGEIRLNWRLVQLPPALLDYVVVHELAHLREMNHSPRFWAIVAAAYPDWRAARAALKPYAADRIHLQGVTEP